jgi:hypothetical protein
MLVKIVPSLENLEVNGAITRRNREEREGETGGRVVLEEQRLTAPCAFLRKI